MTKQAKRTKLKYEETLKNEIEINVTNLHKSMHKTKCKNWSENRNKFYIFVIYNIKLNNYSKNNKLNNYSKNRNIIYTVVHQW